MAGNTSDLKLNKEQIDAIKHKGGPLLVIAGAGTGKTTVITERIKFLIEKDLAKPSDILALTFTEKAAREMEERVDVALPYGYTQMWISTFHSFCDKILRQEILHIGMDPRYRLMTETEAIQLVRSNLFKMDLNYFRPLGNPTKFISGMLQHFSRLQDEDISPAEYKAWVEKRYKKNSKKIETEEKVEEEKYRELADAYQKYDELKVKDGLMDFGDLIVKTLKLLRERPNILKEYRARFKYILVDEFQDTNYAQNELIKLLVTNGGNITVVADDDQSIYRFRGAAVSNVVQFRKSFPKTQIIVLTKNYRSSKEILDRAYDLIQNNNPDRLEVVEKINKKLTSEVNRKNIETVFIHTDRVENEADEVAKQISNLVQSENYKYKDFAVLVRANSHSEPFGRAFLRHGIPYQFLGPGRLFRQPEVIDLISYLKVLYNFEDSVSFYRVISDEYFDISPRDLAAMGNYARKYNLSLFEACEKADELLISEETKEKVKKLLEVINKHLKLVRKETAGQLLYYFLQDTGLIQKLLNPDSADAEKKAQNISKFFDKLKTYEVDHEDASVFAVVDWLELSMELGESPLATNEDWSQANAVNILTVHSSKGLEFPVVFLVNLVSQRFPSVERREQIPIPDEIIKEVLPSGDFHMQEERRLFYVGMTRACQRLFFTAADYYGEGKREKKLSPFIFEALGDKTASSEQKNPESEQLSFLDYKPPIKSSSGITEERQKYHVDYLSYSQIETFETCPLHYKLRYIYKVPTPPSSAQSFGISMHSTLQKFYQEVKSGSKASEKLILQCLSDSWVKEGYSNKEHENRLFEEGKHHLIDFLRNHFDPKVVPEVTEHPFTIPLNGVSQKGKSPLKIGGKIDRLDVLPDGTVEIVDYKTGTTLPTQKEVDENLQLSFYALAASKIPFAPFGRKPEQIKLSLFYFHDQVKMSTRRSAKQLEEAIEKIFSVREKIEKSDFKCSNHMFCQNTCEYSLFCKSDQDEN